jgi:aldehyde dehydrogenase (NAD+)
VQESVSEALLEKVRRRMSTLRVGAPLDKAVDVGAIVARVQLERIDRLVKQGVAEGATCWQPEGFALPSRGHYFPPTLLSNVQPASTVAQLEIFGPVLAAMTFRTPREAVELANNTAYGLAASVWSESVNVALQVASQVKAGVVWVNSTNLFDAACGFGGYRESGYGREGGREGMLEYLEPAWFAKAPSVKPGKSSVEPDDDGKHGAEKASKADGYGGTLSIDRTVKLYVGGKQARPDSGYSFEVHGSDGKLLGEAPLGNRKDIRNAVEAARKAADGWAKATAHNRAQILYYIAENFSQRGDEIAARLARVVGAKQARREVAASVERVFAYAAWADKFDGAVHNPPMRNISIAMNEAVGTAGVLCPAEMPLLGFVSTVMPLVAMGNVVVAIPSERYPLVMADLYQVFETSDLPGGVINMVSGRATELLRVLAEHADLDALWSFGDEAQSVMAKSLSTGNLKQVFTNEGCAIDWFDAAQGEGKWWLRHAVQVKNVWVPYGE